MRKRVLARLIIQYLGMEAALIALAHGTTGLVQFLLILIVVVIGAFAFYDVWTYYRAIKGGETPLEVQALSRNIEEFRGSLSKLRVREGEITEKATHALPTGDPEQELKELKDVEEIRELRRDVQKSVRLIPINSLPEQLHKYLKAVEETDNLHLAAFRNSDRDMLRLYSISVGEETWQMCKIEDSLHKLYIQHDVGEGGA